MEVESQEENNHVTGDHVDCSGSSSTAQQEATAESMLGLSGEKETAGPPELIPDHSRCIVHFDIDSFYAQVEEVLDPRLKGKPIGIRQKYLLVTCNYTARKLGARKMESVVEAKKRCPSLIIMDGEDLSRYREASEAIFNYVAGACGSLVQRLGMDEIFADISALIRSPPTLGDGPNSNVTPRTIPGASPASDNTKSSTGQTGEEPQHSFARMFTGHLYAPGSGGHLLEAQTGLEISLGTGTASGDVRSRREIDEDRPYRQNAGDMINRRELRFPGGDSRTLPSSALIAHQTAADLSENAIVGHADEVSNDLSRSNGGSADGVSALVSKNGDLRSANLTGNCTCGCIERLAAASAFAARVRRGLRDEIGYTCSAGIGSSKALAKLAGELHKPDQQTTILPEHGMSMISQLPLRKLPGCGYSTCAKLKAELGITETVQFQAAPWPLLVNSIGHKLAKLLYLLSRGEDPTPVVPSVRPKSMSDEDSFKRGSVMSRGQVERHIKRLAAPLLLRAGERARNHKEAPETLRVGVRRASKGYGHRVTRQCAISSRLAAAWGAVGEEVAAAAAAEAGGLPASWKITGAAEAIAPGNFVVGPPSGMTGGSPIDGPFAKLSESQGSHQMHTAQRPLGRGTRSPSQKSMGNQSGEMDTHQERSVLDRSQYETPTPSKSGNVSPADEVETSPSLSRSSAGLSVNSQSREQRGDLANEALSEVVRLAMAMFDKICPQGEPMNITLLSVGFAGFRDLGGTAQTGITRFFESSSEGQGRRVVGRVEGKNDPYAASAAGDSQPSMNGTASSAPRFKSPSGSGTRARSAEFVLEHKDVRLESTRQQPLEPVGAGASTGDASIREHDDWDGAEVLVVGAGGREVQGHGGLDWCSSCGAHVLQQDVEEHVSSEFHKHRISLDSTVAAAAASRPTGPHVAVGHRYR